MPLLDVVLILFLAGFVYYGFSSGLIRAVGSLAGVVLGAWLAGTYYLTLFEWISGIWPWTPNIGKIVCFILAFTVISHAVSWAFTLFEQTFKLATIIPFLSTANRILGALFGFIEGALALGLILYIAGRYLPAVGTLGEWIGHSSIVSFLIDFSKILAPLLPEAYKKVRSLI